MNDCQAFQPVEPVFGASGQLSCHLGMAHQGALHYDQRLHVWWMRLIPGAAPENLPPAVRMNEDIPAALQGEWNRA
jgi:hypothetical protein